MSESEISYLNVITKPIISIDYDNQRDKLYKIYQPNSTISNFEEVFDSLKVATDLVIERDGYKGDFSYAYSLEIQA